MALIFNKEFNLWVVNIVLGFIFIFPFTAQAVEFSPALQSLHTEIKRTIPHNSARTIDGVTLKNFPGSYAVIMGLAMQKQKTMMGITGQETFDALDREIVEILFAAASLNKDKNPSDGSSLTGDKMSADYNAAMLGFWNETMQKHGINMNKVQMRSVLVLPVRNNEPSPALQDLHRQMVKTIPMKWSKDIETTCKKMPIPYALSVGFAMQRLFQMAAQSPKDSAQLNDIEREIKANLKQLARQLNYINPRSGEPMPYIKLLAAYGDASSGSEKINQWAKRELGFYPPQLPLEPLARFAQVEETPPGPDQIFLFGEKIPPAIDHEAEDAQGARQTAYNGSGLVCPTQLPQHMTGPYYWLHKFAFNIDDGNNNDDSWTQCMYFKDGRLERQALRDVTGTSFLFEIKNSVYYMSGRSVINSSHRLSESYELDSKGRPWLYLREGWTGEWRGSKRDGISEQYDILPNGKVWLKYKTYYVKGREHGKRIDYRRISNTNKVYKQYENTMVNGKYTERVVFNPDGSIAKGGDMLFLKNSGGKEKYETYNKDGSIAYQEIY